MKKSQVSIEFILIFSFSLLIIAGFMYLTYSQVAQLSDKRDYVHMTNLANLIRNEIILASQVKSNYIRRFDLPSNLNGKEYVINLTPKNSILKNEMEINLIDNNKNVLKKYFTILPVKVKGGFLEEMDPEMLDYCITQDMTDGVRIARNQASIEFYSWTTDGNTYYFDDTEMQENLNDGVLDVSSGDSFEVFVRINCVENVQAIRFTLYFPEQLLEFDNYGDEDMLAAVQNNELEHPEDPYIMRTEGAFFDEIFDVLPHSGDFWNLAEGTITTGIIAKDFETGSGDISIIKFNVLDIQGEGQIEFHPGFTSEKKQNLVILDITTGRETTGGLPDSKVGATIRVA